MSRSALKATVRSLLDDSPGPHQAVAPPFEQPNHNPGYTFRLGDVSSKQGTVVSRQPEEPYALELEAIPRPEPAYSPEHPVEVKASNTSTSSEESADAVSPIFTAGQRSKRSSQDTSILLGEDQAQSTRVPTILLNGDPLDLDELEKQVAFFPGRITRHLSQAKRARRPTEHTLSQGESPKSRPDAPSQPFALPVVDWFKLPPCSSPSTPKQLLTASLLTSLAPALIKWRLVTFYGPFFPARFHGRLTEEAHTCLSLKASQINSVEWPKTWAKLQAEQISAATRSIAAWFHSPFPSSGSMMNIILSSAKSHDVPPIQLSLAIQALALAYNPKTRPLSATGLAEMKEWDALARIILYDAGVFAAATVTPGMMPPRPTSLSAEGEGKEKQGQNDRAEEPWQRLEMSECYKPLMPLRAVLGAAHRRCTRRYFGGVEWEGSSIGRRFGGGKREARAWYKLSREEDGDWEGRGG